MRVLPISGAANAIVSAFGMGVLAGRGPAGLPWAMLCAAHGRDLESCLKFVAAHSPEGAAAAALVTRLADKGEPPGEMH